MGTASSDSGFCSKTDVCLVLYASPDFATSLIETIVRDRFVHRRQREILLEEVIERAWALIATKPKTKLTLLDLRQDGCTLIGARTDTVNARNHAAGRAFGKVIHADHEDIGRGGAVSRSVIDLREPRDQLSSRQTFAVTVLGKQLR